MLALLTFEQGCQNSTWTAYYFYRSSCLYGGYTPGHPYCFLYAQFFFCNFISDPFFTCLNSQFSLYMLHTYIEHTARALIACSALYKLIILWVQCNICVWILENQPLCCIWNKLSPVLNLVAIAVHMQLLKYFKYCALCYVDLYCVIIYFNHKYLRCQMWQSGWFSEIRIVLATILYK